MIGRDLVVNNWYHLAVAFDASAASVEFFLNGESIGISSSFASGIADSSAAFTIGALADPAGYFDGLIDEVRVWNDVRSQTEIEDNMYERLTGSESNLMGYWTFDGNADDLTTNSNDLVLNESPSYSNEPAHHVSCSGIVGLSFLCQILGLF